jgi:hypothetical protein
VVKLVHAFVAAYSDGDLTRLDRIFTPEPDFRWYFDQVRRGTKGTKVTDRSKLLDYFRGRHEQNVASNSSNWGCEVRGDGTEASTSSIASTAQRTTSIPASFTARAQPTAPSTSGLTARRERL